MDIIVIRRNADYMAFLYGHPDIWESGETEEYAIGKLVISLYNRKEFNVSITRRLEYGV